MNRRLPAVIGPRYITRVQHGTHQIFDTVYYGVVDAKPTAAAAQDRADQLNARPARPAPAKGRRS